jgi:hypothetical protein
MAAHNRLVGGSSPLSPTTQSHTNRDFPVSCGQGCRGMGWTPSRGLNAGNHLTSRGGHIKFGNSLWRNYCVHALKPGKWGSPVGKWTLWILGVTHSDVENEQNKG